LQEDTNELEIFNRSTSDVELYLNTTENTPAYYIPAETVRYISNIKHKASKIILEFANAVSENEFIIHELREI
jgi:hypothetical protein